MDSTAVFNMQNQHELLNLIKTNQREIKELKKEGYKTSSHEILKQINFKLRLL